VVQGRFKCHHILFYADDIMVICKRNISSIPAFKDLFQRYALVSGQIVNIAKSTIDSGSIPSNRLANIVNLIVFNTGSLPFNYLGVPIFRGKPKVAYLQPISDKIKLKFSAWKASLLSIAERIQMGKSVIQGMLIHNMSIYS